MMVNYRINDELGVSEFADAAGKVDDVVWGLPDVVAVAILLDQARGLIQGVMTDAQFDLLEGKPNSRTEDLDKLRQIVTRFSETSRHLVQPTFGPGGRWPGRQDARQ
jgi:hypothetical protein